MASRRPREPEPPRVVIRESRRDFSRSDTDTDRRRRRRISPASSEEDLSRRKIHDDASAQDSDLEYSPPPPEPGNDADTRYRPMVPFSWRNEICRFLDVSPDALDKELKARYEASKGPLRYEIIHSVCCEQSKMEGRRYLNQPWVVESGPNNAHLRGSQPILNFKLFLERNKEVIFIIYKDYRCCGLYLLTSLKVNLVREYILKSMAEEWKIVDELLARKKIYLKYMDYLFVPDQISISTEQGRDVSKL
ncbi:Histone acetyltransferase GCN5 [Fusarium oxysporum f. sp. albedinis]|nr:Histone acetyltransferase GCN5 [Fusarium oxysporum f. sp. albedinis]